MYLKDVPVEKSVLGHGHLYRFYISPQVVVVDGLQL